MKVFIVTGWTQYKTDAAVHWKSTQLALTAKSAIDDVIVSVVKKDMRYNFSVQEV